MSAEDRDRYDALVAEEELLALRVKIAEHKQKIHWIENKFNSRDAFFAAKAVIESFAFVTSEREASCFRKDYDKHVARMTLHDDACYVKYCNMVKEISEVNRDEKVDI